MYLKKKSHPKNILIQIKTPYQIQKSQLEPNLKPKTEGSKPVDESVCHSTLTTYTDIQINISRAPLKTKEYKNGEKKKPKHREKSP